MALSKSLDGVAEKLSTTHLEVHATRKDMIETFKIVKAMQEEAEQTKKKEVIKNLKTWLTYTDPATSHQAACRKWQPGTGEWLIDGIRFREWKRSRGSFMWLNGIRELLIPSMRVLHLISHSWVRKDNTGVSIA